jgi:predicted Na+-dependent transporter
LFTEETTPNSLSTAFIAKGNFAESIENRIAKWCRILTGPVVVPNLAKIIAQTLSFCAVFGHTFLGLIKNIIKTDSDL